MRPPDRSRGMSLLVAVAIVTVTAVTALTGQQEGFTFVAIGDTGDTGEVLNRNGQGMEALRKRLAGSSHPLKLLLFLGDNFYPNGLSGAAPDWMILRDGVLAPLRPVIQALGRDAVHAIAGNHDYYCANVMGLAYGFCGIGNRREAQIDAWTYYYYYPALIRMPLAEGSADSVDFLLFDSSYPIVRPVALWRRPLDTLERLLRRSATSPGVTWRILITHHSPYSIGEHAGWRLWNPSRNRVGYIANCWKGGQDPFRWVYEFVSPQDNCADPYLLYADSLEAVVQRSGVKVQALMAGHEHSLQLLHYPDTACGFCPDVYVISGSGSKRDRVKSPAPPREFSHPLNNPVDEGRSVGGFVSGAFEGNRLRLEFRAGDGEDPIDMGGGVTTFVIDQSGALVETR